MLRLLPFLGILSLVSFVEVQALTQYFRDRTRLVDFERLKCLYKEEIFKHYQEADTYKISLDKDFGMPHLDLVFGESSYPFILDFGNNGNIIISNAISDKIDYKEIKKSYTYTPNGEIRGEAVEIELSTFKLLNKTYEKEKSTLVDWSIFSTSPMNGLIGLKYLQNCIFTLDYEARILALSQEDINLEGEKIHLLDLPYHPYGIHFIGKVNGKDAIIYLDTGKSHTEINSALLDKDELVEDKSGRFYPGLIDIQLGNKHFSIEYPRVKHMQRDIDSEYPLGIYIGSDILKYMTLTLDRRNSKNYLIIH